MTTDSADQGYTGPENVTTSDGQFNSIAFIVRQMIAQMGTMKVVKVEKVTSAGDVAIAGTVDVLPLVSQIDGQGNVTPHGTIYGIPYFRLQGGKNAVIMDPQVGDIGYMVVSDRDISAVKSAKKQSPPGSRRQFDLADGVYVGGILNDTPDQYVRFYADGVSIVSAKKVEAIVGSAKITLSPTSSKMEFGSNNILIDGTAIHLNGPVIFNGVAGGIAGTVDFGSSNVTTTGVVTGGTVTGGTVTSAGKVLATHTHGGVTIGGGTTGPPS